VTASSERAIRAVRAAVRRPGTALLGAVVLLLALGVAADLTAGQGAAAGPVATRGDATRPAGSTARTVAVARADAVCPDPTVDTHTETRLSLAAPGAPATAGGGKDAAGPGHARLTGLHGADTPLDLIAPSSGSVLAGPDNGPSNGPDTGPVVARGTGASAPGMSAGLLTRSGVPAMRGLLGTSCAAPGTDFWFVGSGAVVGQRGRVYLTNPEPAPAVVDVTLYGPDGAIDAPAGSGIAVAPGAQEVTLLDALAPGITVFAVHVHVRSGRISAAVRDQQVAGLTPKGADWLPPAAAPARHQLVPGVLSGTGERRLQVVAPGESDAIVKVRLVAESGTFAPAGLDVIEVAAGTVKDIDLAPFGTGDAFAVDLDSDVPVTAGVLDRVTATGSDVEDVAYAAAGLPLRAATPGVVPEARVGTGVASTLLLAAPAGAVHLRLSVLPPATGTPRELTVPAGSQLPVDLATLGATGSFAVLVRPLAGSGPLYAVREVSQSDPAGPLVTSEPVLPGRYTVRVPRVLADLSTGLRAPG
jgi:hypothetical protein